MVINKVSQHNEVWERNSLMMGSVASGSGEYTDERWRRKQKALYCGVKLKRVVPKLGYGHLRILLKGRF